MAIKDLKNEKSDLMTPDTEHMKKLKETGASSRCNNLVEGHCYGIDRTGVFSSNHRCVPRTDVKLPQCLVSVSLSNIRI